MSLFNESSRSGSQPIHRTMSVGVRRLQEALNMHLDVESKSRFVEALNRYHVSRDIPMFVRSLKQILDTPAKKQMFGLIRKVIPKVDMDEFDRCVQFHGKKFDTMPAKRSRKTMQRSRSPLPGGDFRTLQPFKKQQKQKKMKESKRKEMDGKESDSSRSTQNTLTSKSTRSLKSAMKDKGSVIKKVHMKQSDNPEKGYGFSIRGGLEFGLGIYVSMIDKDGIAEKQGLAPGDLILEANNITFDKISHNEAAKVIRAAKKLDLKLCRVGRIPGTFVVHQMYKWVDAHSCPVSPPPELEQIGQLDSLGRRSGFSLLKGADERKINITVQRGIGLGLMIRGGREFGLGIYISGVDPFSVADDNGLKVGDQILDINGQSFLDITHAEAVKILKLSTHMIMTIKDVGKLPYARTKIDETHWLNNGQPPRRKRNDSQKSDSTVTQASSKSSMFRKGLGSQLMLNSSIHTKWDNIQDQASELLNETEQGTLRYYLSEYQRGYISVDGLLMASFELLNTKAKMTMMSEIRKWVRPRDLTKFNVLLQRREAQQNKLFRSSSSLDGRRNGGFGRLRHRLSEGAIHNTLSSPPSRSQSNRERPGRLRRQASESELESLRWAIEQIEDDPDFNIEFQRMSGFSSVHHLSMTPEIGTRQSKEITHSTVTPDELEPFQSLRLRSMSSENLSSPNLHQTSLSSRRSLSVETLTPVYIDTTSELPPSPRQRPNSASTGRPRSRSNSASQRHRPKESYSHRQRSGSNSSSLRRRHKSMEDVRSPSPTVRRIKSPYPSRRNSDDNIRDTLSSVSYTHLKNADSEFEDSPVISRSQRSLQSTNIVYADVHQPPRPADSNPSDDSGVEVNGNHGNGLNRVTISADHPVDIDDVLERRAPVMPSNINVLHSRNSTLTNHNNPYKSNNSTLNNQKASTKPRRSVQNVFDNYQKASPRISGTGSVSSVRSDRRRPPVEIRINDGEGSIETMSIETPSSPHFVNQARNSFVHQSYMRSKRNHQLVPRINRSPAYKDSDSDDEGNDDYDDETEIFDTHSDMGDNSDFYVSPLDRVLDKEDYDGYSEREDKKLSDVRRKYGDIPLNIIHIYKTKPTLGMAIEGGANTRQPLPRVINLQPGGSAYESGGLKVGHVILEVNNRPMAGLEHIAAAKVIAEAFKNKASDTMELLVTESSVKVTL